MSTLQASTEPLNASIPEQRFTSGHRSIAPSTTAQSSSSIPRGEWCEGPSHHSPRGILEDDCAVVDGAIDRCPEVNLCSGILAFKGSVEACKVDIRAFVHQRHIQQDDLAFGREHWQCLFYLHLHGPGDFPGFFPSGYPVLHACREIRQKQCGQAVTKIFSRSDSFCQRRRKDNCCRG